MEALSVFMGLTAPVKKTERRRMIIHTPGELPTEINPEGIPNKVVWSSLDVESVLAEVGQVDDVRRDRFSSDTREVALKMGWVCWDREGKTFGSQNGDAVCRQTTWKRPGCFPLVERRVCEYWKSSLDTW